MLFVPYSWMRLMRFSRSPVRMDAIAMTVDTPITMPSTVKALRNLCALMLSSARPMISLYVIVAIFIVRASILRQRDNRIEPRRPICRINAGDHSDPAGNDESQDNVRDRDRHWDGS